ncbi:MAG: hypothetical protein WC329_08170 [Candidatus Omnitrophota bacterium]|jgi:hypothetical protein
MLAGLTIFMDVSFIHFSRMSGSRREFSAEITRFDLITAGPRD